MCKQMCADYYIILAIAVILLLVSNACSSEDKNPTEPNTNSELVGQWKISKMISIISSDSVSYSQTELDSLGLIWQLNFNSDNTAEQITNLSGPTTTQTGTWSTNGDILSLSLKAPTTDEVHTLDYKYVIENNILKLSWSLPSGTEFIAEFTKQ